MSVINPNLVPTISPGNLFDRFNNDASLAIRWLIATDPVYFDVLNRPTGDVALRQLILAKTLDILNLRLGHQALFPYLIQPQVVSGTTVTDVPLGWIWDMHVSLPKKWEHLRLARIKRVSGHNASTGSDTQYTGKLRLVFTANQVGSAIEVSLLEADYEIDSQLTYQIASIRIPTASEEPNPVDQGEAETIGGWVTFRTLDVDDTTVQSFLNYMAPPIGTEDSSGEYPTPTIYEVNDSSTGGASNPNDFDVLSMSHGTGLLTLSAWNPIPALDSDIETWLLAFNYPFDSEASIQSATHPTIIVPKGLFKEFNVVAPASDEPTGDTTGTYFPVWLSGIERLDAGADALKFIFSTYAVGQPISTTPIEFATLELHRDYDSSRVVPIVPDSTLFPLYDVPDFQQGFGSGFVALSSKWGATTTEIDDFFDLFKTIIDSPPKIGFTKSEGRVSSYGISRVPKYTPTVGQSGALNGTKFPSNPPTATNRYVVEADQGAGDAVDFRTNTVLPVDKRDNPDIEPIGYVGSLCHKSVVLIVNSSGTDHDYSTDILPRLKILFGRDPIYGDEWFDGTRFKKFTGDTWVG